MNKRKIYKFNKDGDVFTGTRAEDAEYYGLALSTLHVRCCNGEIIRTEVSVTDEYNADEIRYARRHETLEDKVNRRRYRDMFCQLAILSLEAE